MLDGCDLLPPLEDQRPPVRLHLCAVVQEEEFRTGPLSVLTTSVKTNSQVPLLAGRQQTGRDRLQLRACTGGRLGLPSAAISIALWGLPA